MTLAFVLTAESSGNMAGILPLYFFGAIIVALVVATLVRMRELRRAVHSKGWTWLGNDPPWDLPFREIFDEPTRDVVFKNAFSGIQNSLEFVACDCIFGQAKSSSYVSTIAVRSSSNPLGENERQDNIVVVQSGAWWAVVAKHGSFPRRRVLSVKETIALIQSLGSKSSS